MIEAGTVLGGRYLIERERAVDHDEVPSWWAVDRQLRRRVVVVVLPGGTSPLEIARNTGLDVTGRLLDGGEHEQVAYLVIRADAVEGDGGSPPPGAAVSGADPSGDAPTQVAGPAAVVPPVDNADATTISAMPSPIVHGDTTAAQLRPVLDATSVQPLPTLAPAGAYIPPPPPEPRSPLSNQTLMRSLALGSAAFVLGAAGMLVAAVVAAPEPAAPPAPVTAAADDSGAARSTETLPSDPGPAPTGPVTAVDPADTTTSTTTTVPSTRTDPSTTTAESTPSTTRPRRTTTTRRRGRWWTRPTVSDEDQNLE